MKSRCLLLLILARIRAVVRIAYNCAESGTDIFSSRAPAVHIRSIAGALAARGHRVTVFCRENRLGVHPGKMDPGVSIVRIPTKRPLGRMRTRLWRSVRRDGAVSRGTTLFKELEDFAHNWKLQRVLEKSSLKEKFDFVLERYSAWGFAGQRMAAKSNIPFILEVNYPAVVDLERFEHMTLAFLARRIENKVWRQADKIVVVSEELKKYLAKRGISPVKMEVLPNGVSVDRFRSLPDGRKLREDLALLGKFVIGLVSGFATWQGADMLAPILDRLNTRGKNWHLLLVGEGPAGKALRESLASRGLQSQSTWVGQVPNGDLPDYLSVMDAAVAPIYNRFIYGSSMKLFEYMAAGLPVVASRWGQHRIVVSHEKTGLLAASGDPEDFARQIVRIRDNAAWAKKLGRSAREHVLGRYTWERNACRIEALARSLAR